MPLTRRNFLAKTAGATGAVLGSCLAPRLLAAGGKNEPARNVLFIVIDDLKPLLGTYGQKTVKTPNIDRLAAGGTRFDRAYCQIALCAPSRASLLTGRSPDATRVIDLKTDFRKALPDGATLPQHFKNCDYHVEAIGKIFHGHTLEDTDPPSWSVPWTMGSSKPHHIHTAKGPDGKPLLFFKDAATECLDVPDDAYADGERGDKIAARIRELATGDKPFFLGAGFFLPHLPFCPPKKYWDLYDRDSLPMPEWTEKPRGAHDIVMHDSPELRGYSDIPDIGPLDDAKKRELIHGYHASVSYVDAQVGKLLDALKSAGIEDSTTVVLWGDHGWHLGDHGLWGKFTNFEEATRAPLIIRHPGAPGAGTPCNAVVEFLDIYPTLCALAGLKAPKPLDGASLAPFLAKQKPEGWKDAAVSLYHRREKDTDNVVVGYSLRTPTHRYTEWVTNDLWRKHSDPWGLVKEGNRTICTELYDYGADPLETQNFADNPAYEKIRVELAKRLRDTVGSRSV